MYDIDAHFARLAGNYQTTVQLSRRGRDPVQEPRTPTASEELIAAVDRALVKDRELVHALHADSPHLSLRACAWDFVCREQPELYNRYREEMSLDDATQPTQSIARGKRLDGPEGGGDAGRSKGSLLDMDDDPDALHRVVEAQMKKTGQPYTQAFAAVCENNPQLYESYRKQQRRAKP
jgi:hypothetical protein